MSEWKRSPYMREHYCPRCWLFWMGDVSDYHVVTPARLIKGREAIIKECLPSCLDARSTDASRTRGLATLADVKAEAQRRGATVRIVNSGSELPFAELIPEKRSLVRSLLGFVRRIAFRPTFFVRLIAPERAVFYDGATVFQYGSPVGHPKESTWAEQHSMACGMLAGTRTFEEWEADPPSDRRPPDEHANLVDLYRKARELGAAISGINYGWDGFSLRMTAPKGYVSLGGHREELLGGCGSRSPIYSRLIEKLPSLFRPAPFYRSRQVLVFGIALMLALLGLLAL